MKIINDRLLLLTNPTTGSISLFPSTSIQLISIAPGEPINKNQRGIRQCKRENFKTLQIKDELHRNYH